MGFMLSFVVFVAFVIFLYSVLQPAVKLKEEKQSALASAKEKLISNFSEDYDELTMVLSSTYVLPTGKTCIITPIPFAEKGRNFLIKHNDNNVYGTNTTAYVNILFSDVSSRFFKMFFANSTFTYSPKSLSSCDDPKTKISVASVQTRNSIFGARISRWIDNYNKNSESAKQSINFPSDANIQLIFKFANNSIAQTISQPLGNQVFSETLNVQYVNLNAQIKTGTLTINVW